MVTRRTVQSFILIMIFLVSALVVNAANEGTVLSLSATGGSTPGETITISATIRADTKMNNTNITFQIISPGGVVVATHSFDPPAMESGDTISHSWTSNNSSYPDIGSYTLSICWSPGGSSNCSISGSSTTFYSADSLGPMAFIGLAMIGLLVFRARKLEVASE